MGKSLFDNVKTEEIKFYAGARYELPVRYLDWSSIHALFPAPAAKVRRLLPSRKLKPLLLTPGKAVVSLMAMEYRQIAGVGPYNEFMVGVPVQYEPIVNIPGLSLLFNPLLSLRAYKKFGVYVHRLPVTTEESNYLGREIWGYPKTMAEIIFEDEGQVRRCRLGSGGADVVTLEVKKMPTKEQSMDLYSYTVKDNQLLRMRIQTWGHYGISRTLGGAAYILGQGPIAEELRALEIGKKALGCFYSEHVQSILPAAGERLEL